MKITIIGASSGLGLETVKQALAKGHEVTTLSRGPVPLPDQPGLNTVKGSSTQVDDVKKVIKNADAVIVAIGATGKKTTTLFEQTALALVEAAANPTFTAPVLAITGFGTGKSSSYLNLFMWVVINLFLKKEYADKSRMEEIFLHSTLQWVIVKPGMLTNEARTGTYQVLTKLVKGIKIKKISRADVADLLIKEAENPRFIKQYIAITY